MLKKSSSQELLHQIGQYLAWSFPRTRRFKFVLSFGFWLFLLFDCLVLLYFFYFLYLLQKRYIVHSKRFSETESEV